MAAPVEASANSAIDLANVGRAQIEHGRNRDGRRRIAEPFLHLVLQVHALVTFVRNVLDRRHPRSDAVVTRGKLTHVDETIRQIKSAQVGGQV